MHRLSVLCDFCGEPSPVVRDNAEANHMGAASIRRASADGGWTSHRRLSRSYDCCPSPECRAKMERFKTASHRDARRLVLHPPRAS